jgi:hypothetical protein
MGEIKKASSRTVAKLIERWPTAFVRCRSWRHTWADYDVLQTPKRFVVVRQCTSCDALQHRSLSLKNGAPLGDWVPHLPPGYQVPPGTGRIVGQTRNQLYFAAVHRGNVRHVPEDKVSSVIAAAVKGQGEHL